MRTVVGKMDGLASANANAESRLQSVYGIVTWTSDGYAYMMPVIREFRVREW